MRSRWNVRRSIEFFEINSDRLAGEIPLGPTKLEELQRLFGQPDDDPMYDVYAITSKEAEYFERHHSITFEFLRYEYFLACARSEKA